MCWWRQLLWAAFLALILLSLCCWPLVVLANPADVAGAYGHVREKTNRNDAPEIAKFLAWQGLGPGYAWCQAFAGYCVDTDAGRRVMPRTASVHQGVKWALKNRFRVEILAPRQVQFGAPVPRGMVVAFKHGFGADAETFSGNGHAALAESWAGPTGRTVEGNTKPGPEGDQRGGSLGDLRGGHDGVYRRTRSLGLLSGFPIVLFYLPRY